MSLRDALFLSARDIIYAPARMRIPPLEVAATWPLPNYTNPTTRGPALMIVELVLLPLALISVSLRLWIRIRWLRRSWWDDYLMLVAAIWSIGTTILVILGTYFPAQRHSSRRRRTDKRTQQPNSTAGTFTSGTSPFPRWRLVERSVVCSAASPPSPR